MVHVTRSWNHLPCPIGFGYASKSTISYKCSSCNCRSSEPTERWMASLNLLAKHSCTYKFERVVIFHVHLHHQLADPQNSQSNYRNLTSFHCKQANPRLGTHDLGCTRSLKCKRLLMKQGVVVTRQVVWPCTIQVWHFYFIHFVLVAFGFGPFQVERLAFIPYGVGGRKVHVNYGVVIGLNNIWPHSMQIRQSSAPNVDFKVPVVLLVLYTRRKLVCFNHPLRLGHCN